MIGVIRDVTDDDEEIKLSPFVKKIIMACEKHSQLSLNSLMHLSSHASPWI